MSLIPYIKPHASPSDWVAHLISRGLVVPDIGVAEHQIELIGYHRLRIYLLSRRSIHTPLKPFIAGTTFNDIVQIYDFDAKLRSVCFDACGKFELLFRNSIAEKLSNQYGSHPHFELAAYKDQAARRDAVVMLTALYAKSKDPRARYYLNRYEHPVLPPIWTMKEFLTFGATDRFFGLLSANTKNQVAHDFGIRSLIAFESLIKCLVDLRNICAHHDRLFNRSMQKQPPQLRNAGLPVAPPNKPKAIFECLDWLIQQRGLNSDLTAYVEILINSYPAVRRSEVGY